MGYRHQVMSDSMVPHSNQLPTWFVDKYSKFIDLDHDFWVSHIEYKRYGVLSDFEIDIQKVLIETNSTNKWGINLVYYADEGGEDQPDISFVHITADSIVEKRADQWIAVEKLADQWIT